MIIRAAGASGVLGDRANALIVSQYF